MSVFSRDHRRGLVPHARQAPIPARDRRFREARLSLVQPGRDEVAARLAGFEGHEMRELVADRGDRPTVAHRCPVDQDHAQTGLEERDGVLRHEGRRRARVTELMDQSRCVARGRREHLDRGSQAKRPGKFLLHGGEVVHDLVVEDAQVGELERVLDEDIGTGHADR